jgi:hypothetical protein
MSSETAIQKISYTHDAMIDYIVANPTTSQNEIARAFGYTAPWISRIFASDAFQARLAERKTELVNPVIVANVEERIQGLAMQSIEILEQKLAQTQNPDLAVKVFELSTKAAGYGARKENVGVQNNFVVHLPNKINDPHSWAAAHRPGGAATEPMVIEAAEIR